MEKLQQLLDEGVIDEVHNQLKTGKEAEVWLVSHHGEPVAAKIYKAREFRSFKNDAGYKEGRQVRNTRTQRAMDKGSKFGRASAEEAWKSMEADTMFNLHAAGVRVPRPVMFYEGVLLMEVVGDAEGRVAPRLVEAHIPREQAGPMYAQLRQEAVKMLAQDYIHGDLSEFNILLGASGPVIIDFPQVITAAKNSQSEKYFRRDLGNLLRFFSAIDPSLEQKHAGDADEIWREYVRRDLSPSFVPSGRRPFQGGAPQRGPQQGRPGGPRVEQRGGPRVEHRGGPGQGDGARHANQQGGRPDQQRGGPRHGSEQGGRPDQRRGERHGSEQGGRPEQSRGERHANQQGGRPDEQRGGPRHGNEQGGRPEQQRGERHANQQGGRADGQRGERSANQQGGRSDEQRGGGPRHANQQGGRGGPQSAGPAQQGGRPDPRGRPPRGDQQGRSANPRGGRPQGPVVERRPAVSSPAPAPGSTPSRDGQ